MMRPDSSSTSSPPKSAVNNNNVGIVSSPTGEAGTVGAPRQLLIHRLERERQESTQQDGRRERPGEPGDGTNSRDGEPAKRPPLGHGHVIGRERVKCMRAASQNQLALAILIRSTPGGSIGLPVVLIVCAGAFPGLVGARQAMRVTFAILAGGRLFIALAMT